MTNPNDSSDARYWTPESALKLSDSAQKMVGLHRKKRGEVPDTERVQQIKRMGAALITMAQDTAVAMPWSARHVALTITNLELAMMWIAKATDPQQEPDDTRVP
jgi:hypothetical protein